MYVRSRKPAAGIASASTTRYETSNARYISTESAKYGTTEVAMSSRLRPRRGRVYGARASRQKGRSLPGPPELGAAPIAAAGSRVLLAPFPLASAATGAPAARGFAEDPRALLTPAAERHFPPTRFGDSVVSAHDQRDRGVIAGDVPRPSSGARRRCAAPLSAAPTRYSSPRPRFTRGVQGRKPSTQDRRARRKSCKQTQSARTPRDRRVPADGPISYPRPRRGGAFSPASAPRAHEGSSCLYLQSG